MFIRGLTRVHLRVKLLTGSNQALNALAFVYREELKVELEGVNGQRAKHTKRLPTVLTQVEVAELLN